MNKTSSGVEVVAQWRISAEFGNPAGPLFAAGEFAEADIVCITSEYSFGCTRCSPCSGCVTHPCC